MAKKSENELAFDRVLACFAKMRGSERGAKNLMAKELGVNRQNLTYWEKNGVSRRYVRKVAEITGLKPEDVLPKPY